MSNMSFKMMALIFRIRDLLRAPAGLLERAGVGQGQTVLDYGCGPGSYSVAAAAMVGPGGKVYALDIHPLAMSTVERKAAKMGLQNIETIRSGRDTGLPDGSVDVALLYDTIQAIADKRALLQELHRVIKAGGILSILVEHIRVEDVTDLAAESDLFSLMERDGKLLRLERQRG